ncbi:MAG: DUF488 family protein [Bartonella sp.]|nr:DUF488 family protein [Bartonella sp.]
MKLAMKRVYEAYVPDDGWRVLIDRLWPRGLKRDKAHIDDWKKDYAPSTELRRWFNHDLDRWEEFKHRYELELEKQQQDIEYFYSSLKSHPKVTLLYAAHDEAHNNAVVFINYLKNRISPD